MPLKILNLQKDIVLVKPVKSHFENIDSLTKEVKKIISQKADGDVILDLTNSSFLDSIRLGVLAVTHHFVEFSDGKLYIVVNNNQIKKMMEPLNFNNATIIYNQEILLEKTA